MDMHHHASASTPWNANLSYAIYWNVALAIPLVWLTAKRLFTLCTAQSRRGRRHSPLSGSDDSIEYDQIQQSRPSDSSLPSRHSWTRLENWLSNKFSSTLPMGQHLHLVAGATLLGLIFLSILAVLLLVNGDLMLNSNRAGYLALACIPFLFAFTGKNSIITHLTSMSHHRLNQVHRFLGLCLFILVSVHMGCMFHVWWPWKSLLAQQLTLPKVRYGLATYTTLCLIIIGAAWPVRRWAYEAFVVSHGLFLVFLVLVGLHTPYAMRFTVAGIVLYLISVLTGWCVKTHMAMAQATVFQGRLTRLRMDQTLVHQPGQHIYVCVPSMSLLQWHPFTITSSDSASITVHARAVGGFTRRLCQWQDNTQRRVLLAGPYGESVRVGQGVDSYKTIFMAAGSGMAYVMPILMDLLQNRRQCKTSLAPIHVVWCVRDPDEVQWFQDELELALDTAQGELEMEKDKEDVELIKHDDQETRIQLTLHYSTLAFGDQESLVVPAPTSPLPPVRQGSSPANSGVGSATITTATAATTLQVPFSGDDRVEWLRSRLDVPMFVRRQIEETPKDSTLEIVGCGPPGMLAELHNAVARGEQLSGCRVNLHTERFYV